MSQKTQKKIRQMYRRDTRDAVRQAAETQVNYFKQVLKPRPQWFPKWLWRKLLSIFVRVK